VVTSEQREQLAQDGYFIVKGALTSSELERMTAGVDAAFERHLKVNPPAQQAGMDIGNLIEEDEAFLYLIDSTRTFPLVLDLLGAYIELGQSESTVRLPSADTGDYTGFIHTDGGHALSRIQVSETSRPLQAKTHYFLTDCMEPDMGNFAVVPGSHLRIPDWDQGENITPADVDGVVPLLVEAGDCVMFTHSLWHGAVPNRSSAIRKTITYGYNQMFFRPRGREPSTDLLDKCTLRQRRLLGDLGPDTNPTWFGTGERYFYAPDDFADIIMGEYG
jgi:hypothetical protein